MPEPAAKVIAQLVAMKTKAQHESEELLTRIAAMERVLQRLRQGTAPEPFDLREAGLSLSDIEPKTSSSCSRIQGTLSNWNDTKGFGFAQTVDGRRVFVHSSELQGLNPAKGLAVEFDVTDSAKGLRAKRVTEPGVAPVSTPRPRSSGSVQGTRRSSSTPSSYVMSSKAADNHEKWEAIIADQEKRQPGKSGGSRGFSQFR